MPPPDAPEPGAAPPARMPTADVRVDRVRVTAYTIPTDAPESDGTLAWDATTIVVVHADGGGRTGLGYTYGPPAVAGVVSGMLASIAEGRDALAPQAVWADGHASLRNAGQAGIGALALSALDLALHDLRARLLEVPLARAVGAFHDDVPGYGSGGFTSYDDARLHDQLAGWVGQGIRRVKLKVGREPIADPHRLATVCDAIGPGVALMVDANGAFRPREAIEWAHRYREFGADWLEEPVTSDDPAGMRRVRDAAPVGMDVAAGEYGWGVDDARRLLDAGAVDVLQADVTRCGGLTGLVEIDALCAARRVPLSAHCAPALSAHVLCACRQRLHAECFHDHLRIEALLFDGAVSPAGGVLRPDRSSPGNGLTLKVADAERFAARC